MSEPGADPAAERSSPSGRTVDSVALAAAPYMAAGVDLRPLMTTLVDAVVASLEADRGTLYLVDGASGSLTSFVAHLPEMEAIRLEPGQGIAGWVADQRTPLIVEDPASDPRFDSSFDEQTGYRTRSLLAVPVLDGHGDVIGVLQVLNARAGRFQSGDLAAAEALAAQAGRVLEFTSLHPDLRPRSLLEGQSRAGLFVGFNQVVGDSEPMREVYALVERAAATDATVLLQGESGTGKELIARAVHQNSARRDAPLVKIDCTTLPESLIESQLFGHERGSFTGADRTAKGKFEIADGGTVFLDEIGELPLHVQGKLLRVLQDHEFERVGGHAPIRADIRIVTATHRDLVDMVDQGRFREDLYYRIRVVPIVLPPLRERGEADLQKLVEHFVDRFSRRHGRPIQRLTRAAFDRLRRHDFPGNIRELENCLESAVVLCRDGVIDASDLPLAERRAAGARDEGPRIGDTSVPLAEVELAHVKAVLAACGDNRSEAARRLGIGRNSLARRLSGSRGATD